MQTQSSSIPSSNYNFNKDFNRSEFIECLRRNHGSIENFISLYRNEKIVDMKQRMLFQLIREFSIYSALEGMVLIPFVRSKLGSTMADGLIRDKTELETLLNDLDDMKVGDNQFEPRFSLFTERLERYFRFENSSVFPELLRLSTPQELDTIGGQWQSNYKFAPTRPHPGAPREGNSAVAANMALVAVDMAKDKSRFSWESSSDTKMSSSKCNKSGCESGCNCPSSSGSKCNKSGCESGCNCPSSSGGSTMGTGMTGASGCTKAGCESKCNC